MDANIVSMEQSCSVYIQKEGYYSDVPLDFKHNYYY